MCAVAVETAILKGAATTELNARSAPGLLPYFSEFVTWLHVVALHLGRIK